MSSPDLTCMPGMKPTNTTKEMSPHWYVSYNPSSRDYGCDTTALVLGQGEHFLTLEGDHREALHAIMDDAKPFTLTRCLRYVDDNKDKLHEMSDDSVPRAHAKETDDE